MFYVTHLKLNFYTYTKLFYFYVIISATHESSFILYLVGHNMSIKLW